MQQTPNCSKNTQKSDFFFFFLTKMIKNASENISAVGKMRIPSKNYIIISKNSLCYTAETVLGNAPWASESFVRSIKWYKFQSRTP